MGRRTRKPALDGQPQGDAPCVDVGAGAALDPDGGAARALPVAGAGLGAELHDEVSPAGEQRQRRDFGPLDAALNDITLTLPLALEDVIAVMGIVKQHASGPLIRDVMHNGREIFVRVYDGQAKIYERQLS